MNAAKIERNDTSLLTTWDDGSVTEFPFIWLRDNDPADLHPDTQERTFDLMSIAPDIQPISFEQSDNQLTIVWDSQKSSCYDLTWLSKHRPGQSRQDPSRQPSETWSNDFIIPRFDVAMADGTRLGIQSLTALKQTGIVLFEGLPDDVNAGEQLGRRFGFARETNFGVIFEVQSKPQPENLAYTSLALALHTDLPNQEHVPGYQLLHCYRNGATGGESVFADGFQICEDLRRDAPEQFELLANTKIPWRYHDEDHDIRSHRQIIELDDNGDVQRFTFNAHIADIPDMEAKVLHQFYAAYYELMGRVRRPEYAIHYRLQPGEMVAFDNRRVLHGRNAFDPSTGERYFRGFYLEQNEIDSTLRKLAESISNSNGNQ